MTQRERFEAWVLVNLPTYCVDKFANEGYVHPGTQLAWAAWQAACPEGFVSVPEKITAETGHKYALIGEFSESVTMPCPECDEVETADNDCEYCHGDGDYEQPVPVSWHTIKRIHDAVVSVSAAPKPGEA